MPHREFNQALGIREINGDGVAILKQVNTPIKKERPILKRIGKFIKSLVAGSVEHIPVIGTIIPAWEKSKADELTPPGSPNYSRVIIGTIVGLFLLGRLIRPQLFNLELLQSLGDILLKLF